MITIDTNISHPQESSIPKRMTKTMDFSVIERKQLLQLLQSGKLKITPISIENNHDAGFVDYLGKRLFVKKTRKDNSLTLNSSLDRYIRPDLLLKYKKLLHNKITDIQKVRGNENFYQVTFPEIAVVNQNILVTEALSNNQLKLIQDNRILITFIRNYIGDGFKILPMGFHGALLKYQVGKDGLLEGSSIGRYNNFKKAIEEISLNKHGTQDEIVFGKLGKIIYNKTTRKITFVSPKLKNLVLGRQQFMDDQKQAFRKVFQNKHIGDMHRLFDEYNDFWFFVKEKDGKIYKITNDLKNDNMMLGGRTPDKKPIFVVNDDLWIQEANETEVN